MSAALFKYKITNIKERKHSHFLLNIQGDFKVFKVCCSAAVRPFDIALVVQVKFTLLKRIFAAVEEVLRLFT